MTENSIALAVMMPLGLAMACVASLCDIARLSFRHKFQTEI